MPSTIADLSELTTVAIDDYFLVRDTSDLTNRDKKISWANFLLTVPKKTGTPTAGRVASWSDANTIQDGGILANDIPKLSTANTFNGLQTTTSGGFLGPARGAMSTATESLANNTAVSITDISNTGVVLIVTTFAGGLGSGIFAFRANSGPYAINLTPTATGIVGATGVLLGTTGTAGKITFSTTATAGQCYLENQSGVTITYHIMRL